MHYRWVGIGAPFWGFIGVTGAVGPMKYPELALLWDILLCGGLIGVVVTGSV
jgi:hypothetical protein